MRYRRARTLALTCLAALGLSAAALAQPANNNCGNAQGMFTIPNIGGSATQTVSQWSNDGSPCSAISSSGADVYYYFTPNMTGAWDVSLCSTSTPFDSVLSIHTACPASNANSIACNDNGTGSCAGGLSRIIGATLTGGVPYIIRVANQNGQSGRTFTLTVAPSLLNDTCGQNQASFTIPGTGGSVTGSLANASEDTIGQPICGNSNVDMFYYFTPATSTTYRFSTCSSSTNTNTVISIHTGCPASSSNYVGGSSTGACGLSVAGCSNGSALDSGVLTAGVPLVIRVSRTGSNDNTFTLTVTPNPSGACCETTGACVSRFSLDCIAGRTFVGVGTLCSPNPCGACCAANGACTITATTSCTGTPLASGSGCSPTNPCPGACCDPASGVCTYVAAASCTSSLVFHIGFTCATFACPQPTACCNPGNHICVIAIATVICPVGFVAAFPAATSCNPNPCPTGACCGADGSCTTKFLESCSAANGTFSGVDSACATSPCGACCTGAGGPCTMTAFATCTGTYAGVGSACSPTTCGACHTGNNFIVGTSVATSNSGSRNATTFHVADNFHPTVGGTLSQISWSGLYRSGIGTLASVYHTGTPPTTETWTIHIYEDAGGLPGPEIVGSPFTPSTGAGPNAVHRATDTTFLAAYPAGFFGAGSAAYDETYQYYSYSYTIPTANRPALVNTKCYWLEVTPASPSFDTTFSTTALHWRWAFDGPSSGDEYFHQRGLSTTQFDFTTRATGDMKFCLNLDFSETTPCTAPVPPTCTQADANGQTYDGSTFGYTSASALATVADDFRIDTPTLLNGICFDGFYIGQVGPPKDEAFVVKVYTNGGTTCASRPGTLIATRNLVPAASNLATITPDAFTTIGPNVQPGAIATNVFRWTAAFSAVPLDTGTYWIEIVNQSATQWYWFVRNYTGTPSKNGAGFIFQKPAANPAYVAANALSGSDCVFFISTPLAVPNISPSTPLAPNRTCATAQPLLLNGPTVLGQNINVGTPAANGNNLPPAFDIFINPNHAAVWYTLVGDGTNVRISTCGTGTDPCFPSSTTFDTHLTVYCAENCSEFKTLASNDNDSAATCPVNNSIPSVGASALTLPTIAGQTYYIYVHSSGGATGSFWISASSGTPAAAVPCAQVTIPTCPVLPPAVPGPNDVLESGLPCVIADGNDVCAGALALAPGQTGWGTVFTDIATSNPDYWKMPTSTGGEFAVYVRTESPIVMILKTGGCSGGTGYVNVPSCGNPAIPTFSGPIPAGDWYIVISTVGTNVPCDAIDGHYSIRVESSTAGACCHLDGSCTLVPQSQCAPYPQHIFQAGVCSTSFCQLGACCFTGGSQCNLVPEPHCASAGPSTYLTGTCTPNPCPPGACCDANGGCTINSAVNCTGTSFISAGACTPNPCPQPVACCIAGACSMIVSTACGGTPLLGNTCTPSPCLALGVCCRGATCNTDPSLQSQAACANSIAALTPGAAAVAKFVPSTPCGGTNHRVPCCYADYNQSGAKTVADIFNYLSDWFASRPWAKTPGDGSGGTGGPIVANIFNFLSDWFAGGCP